MTNKLSDKEIMKELDIDAKTLEMFKKVSENSKKEFIGLDKKRTGRVKIIGISGSARSEFDMAQEKSNSEELLEVALEECKKLGADVELIKLRDYKIGYCKACYSTCNTQCHFYCSCYAKNTPLADDMTTKLYDKILAADGIIFATPVNNFAVSSLMKIFLDRCISLDGSLSPANPRSTKDKKLNIKHMKYVDLTAEELKPETGMIRRFSGKVAGIITTGHEEGTSMAISSLFMTLNHFGMLFPPFSNMYAMSSYKKSTFEDKEITQDDVYKKEVKMIAKNVLHGVEVTRNFKPFDWEYDCKMN
jgi:multimeric flavodoxin WrbA